MREAGNQALSLWVRNDQHTDRDRAGRLLGRMGCRRAHSDYQNDLHLHKFGCERGVPVFSTFGVSAFDDEVLTFDEAVITQTLEETL